MNTRKYFSYFFVAVLGGLISFALAHKAIQKNNSHFEQKINQLEAQTSFVSQTGPRVIPNTDFTYAAEKSVNAVVHVKTKYQPQYDDIYYFFFGGQPQNNAPAVGTGSGVIISPDGFIVTNNHVIEKTDYIEVVLNDNRSYKATLIGTDPTTDLALLKIEADNLHHVEYGNSDELKIGEWVLAVGNPFNLTSTVTAGIVSAKARNIRLLDRTYAIEAFIQTDAAVNPGNSGGALVDVKGNLVGINTAIASRTGSFSGYSFAIPSGIVKKVVDDLKEYGVVQRALLGVSISDIDSDLAKELKLDKVSGVLVAGVTENGSADEAGIEKNDVIVAIEGKEIAKSSELQEKIGQYRPGEKIKVTVLRSGKEKTMDVILKNVYGTTGVIDNSVQTILGASFMALTNEDKSRYGVEHGMKVVDLSSGKLMKAGIQKGFVITHINKQPIYDYKDIEKLLEKTKGGVYIDGVTPSGVRAYYAFGLN